MADYYFQNIQDTTVNQVVKLQVESDKPSIGKIDIKRKAIEFTVFERAVESSRVREKPKKVKPIIKTIPFIAENDSLPAPNYNTFTGEFEMPYETQGADLFNFKLIDPIVAENAKEQLNPQVRPVQKEVLAIIQSNELLIVDRVEKQKGFAQTDWMLGILIVSFILFGWINVRFSRFVKSIVSASYNYFSARKLQEESNVVRNKVFMVMNILFFINSALIITQWFDFHNIKLLGQSNYLLFFIFLALIIIIYTFKSFVLLMLDFIFLTRGSFMEYNSTVFIYNKLYGFALLPIVTCIPYVSENAANYLLILAIIVFAILYLMKLLRGIVIGFKNKLSILYLILYLCALEILPLLVLHHAIVMYL